MLLRARVSVSCTGPGSGGRRARSHPVGVRLQEVAAHMKVMHEPVAGIDVHKDMVKVAIRSPGDDNAQQPGGSARAGSSSR